MDKIEMTGQIDFEIKRLDGSIEKWSVNNSIMTVGFAQLALLAGDAAAAPFTYLALGTSTTAVVTSQTALVAEIIDTGLARALASVSRVSTTETNDTLQLVYTWTATGSKTIEEVGIFNGASAGTMLARALTSTKSLVNGETIKATYKVKIA